MLAGFLRGKRLLLLDNCELLARAHGRRTRYRLLETLRQYGRQRLTEAGMESPLRRRHRDHYQRMAAEAADRWCGEQEIEWPARLRRELPNFQEALNFSLSCPGEGGGRPTAAAPRRGVSASASHGVVHGVNGSGGGHRPPVR
ncbi:hypothetical protein [Nonomuraea sp. NPDC003754]